MYFGDQKIQGVETIGYPLLGFRAWSVDTQDMVLKGAGANNGIPWQPGINYATGCAAHPAPGANCDCGFNAWFDLEDSESYPGVRGAIAGAGNIYLHETGFRCSQVQILAFLAEDSDLDLIKKLSRRYLVPVFDTEKELQEFCGKKAMAGIDLKMNFQLVGEPEPEPSSSPAAAPGVVITKTENGGERREYSTRTEWRNTEDLLHRNSDLPAVVDSSGYQAWYQNGELHREGDKPAVIKGDGSKEWWRKGKYFRKNDKPVIINYDGEKQWRNAEGKLHRENDKPALVDSTRKIKEWYKDGELHREKGPAYSKWELAFRYTEYYYKGQKFTDKKTHRAAVKAFKKYGYH